MTLQARTLANKLFIAMYETEEPKKEGFINGPEYLRALTQWQSSKREYKVNDKYILGLRKALFDEVDYGGALAFKAALEKGIDCTFLKDRLKLEVKPCEDCKSLPMMCYQHETYGNEFEWTLLPLEDKKENEAVEFAKKNAEEDYIKTPISVLKYIGVLENQLFKNPNKQ